MDEIFHIPQTQKYCEGRFNEWDPKITTFPGLYMASSALSALLELLFGAAVVAPCSVTFLRAVNVLFGAGTLLLLYKLLRRQMGPKKAAAHALALALYPIHFFYTFLFYTDVGSLFWVLLTHHLALPAPGKGVPSRMRISAAALAGCAAVAFRQTNAVWLMFTFGTAALADLEASGGKRCAWHQRGGGDLSLHALWGFVVALFVERWRLLGRLWPLLVAPVLFVSFVIWNGSIVVGDHSNHQAVVHWAQLAYVSLVTSAFWILMRPQDALSPTAFRRCAAACFRSPLSIVASLLLLCCIAGLLKKYSLAHPFLLADNRHYTFYVWGRLLGRIPGLKEALAPVYFYVAWTGRRHLRATQSDIWILIWCIACILTLLPAHLLEPRYWTTAVVMAHVHAPEESWGSLLIMGNAFLLMNLATLGVFRYKSFVWPDGSIARFMW